jgi:hypothetical protein
MLPTAPDLPKDDLPNYEALVQKQQQDAAPLDPKATAPKWYDRLLGGVVGAGVGFKEGPSAGIREGSAITNRRYTEAAAGQQAQLAQDKLATDNWQHEHDLATQGYERQVQQFGQKLQVAGAEQSQNNNDRDYTRNVSNDQRSQGNSDRDFNERVFQDENTNQYRNDELTETARHNKAVENKPSGDIPSAEANEFTAYERSLGHPATADDVMRFRTGARAGGNGAALGVDENKVLDNRKTAYDRLENGDPAKGVDGFQQRFKAIQTAKVNPTTGKAYTPDERKVDLDKLTRENAQAKNDIEARYAQEMGNLGRQVQPVQYDDMGNVQQPQQGAPAQQQQPAQAQQPQGVAIQKGNGKPLTDRSLAAQYLAKAGNDKAKARALAQADGWKF